MQKHILIVIMSLVTPVFYLMAQVEWKQDGSLSVTGNNAQTFISKPTALDYNSLFKMGADLSGGIIADVNRPSGRNIEIHVYWLEGPGARQDLIYSCYSSTSSTDFKEQTDLFDFKMPGSATTVQQPGNAIKLWAQHAKLYSTGNCPENIGRTWKRYLSNPPCPENLQRMVQIEVTMRDASLKSFKIPGIGILTPAEVLEKKLVMLQDEPLAGKENIKGVSIFPNPSDGNLTIRFNRHETGTVYSISVMEATGKLLSDKYLSSVSETNTILLDLTGLKGTFLVRLVCEKGQVIKKVIIQ